ELRGQSERIQEKLVHLAEGIRRLSHELHPAILQHAGLVAAVEAYCSELSGLASIAVTIEAGGAFEGVPPAGALCVYRVVQEALRNVVRHARVDQAHVALFHKERNLQLVVTDHGVGITAQQRVAPTGLGLISIKERARLVNGTVEIESQPNQGT